MDNFYFRDAKEAFLNYQQQVATNTDHIMYMGSDNVRNVDFFKHSLTRESIAIPTEK